MADAPASESAPPPTPLPPKLRPKPQRRQIGAGKPYATVVEFDADVAAWSVEKQQRKELVKLRERDLDARRDRSGRVRDKPGETDSQRRVRQRRDDKAALRAHADREWDRRADVRAEKQERRVSALSNDLTIALRDCAADGALYEDARLRLDRVLCQLRFAAPDEGRLPDGSFEWDEKFEEAADQAERLPARRSWSIRPALERWQVELLMGLPSDGDWDESYDADADASDWDSWLAKNPAVAGTPAAAISGCDCVAFILKEKRKCKAEAKFEAHLKLERQSYLTSVAAKYNLSEQATHEFTTCSASTDLRDKGSKWWTKALGKQWCKGREKPTSCPCTCNWGSCRCPIGCVLDGEERPVQPLRFAPSSKC